MTFVDRPLPETLELPVLQPRDKRLDNLRNGPGTGRLKGTLNKVTADLKEGITQAAENLGRDGQGAGGLIGYLEFLGWRHPKAFAGLLGKVLPMQPTVERSGTRIETVNIVSVPHDNYLSAEDMARYGHPTLVEHVPQASAPAPIEENHQTPEEERQLIDRLMGEIREMAQRAGVSLDDR